MSLSQRLRARDSALRNGTAHAATTLKISHQFPGGTIDRAISATGSAGYSPRGGQSQRRRDRAEVYPNPRDQDQRAILGMRKAADVRCSCLCRGALPRIARWFDQRGVRIDLGRDLAAAAIGHLGGEYPESVAEIALSMCRREMCEIFRVVAAWAFRFEAQNRGRGKRCDNDLRV